MGLYSNQGSGYPTQSFDELARLAGLTKTGVEIDTSVSLTADITATAPQINAAAALTAYYNNVAQAQETLKLFDDPAPILPPGCIGNWNFAGLAADATVVPNQIDPPVARRINLCPVSEPTLAELSGVYGHVANAANTVFFTATGRTSFQRGLKLTNDDTGFAQINMTSPATAFMLSVYVVMDNKAAPVFGTDLNILWKDSAVGTAAVTQIQNELYRVTLAVSRDYEEASTFKVRAVNTGKPFTIVGFQCNLGTAVLNYEYTPYTDFTLANSPTILPTGVLIGGKLAATSTATTGLIATNKSAVRADQRGPWTLIALSQWDNGNIKLLNTYGSGNRVEVGSASAYINYLRAATDTTTAGTVVNRHKPQTLDGKRHEMMVIKHDTLHVAHFNEAQAAFPADYYSDEFHNLQITLSASATYMGTEFSHVLLWDRELTNEEQGQVWSWLKTQHGFLGDDFLASKPPVLPVIPANGLAQTPPMGFSDWGYYGIYEWTVTDNEDDPGVAKKVGLRGIADAMVSTGLAAVGYHTISVDEGWALMTRDAAGNLQPDPTKFPDGMKVVADYIHSKGLNFGIYTTQTELNDSGVRTGSYGHINQDAKTFAEWGADKLKFDGVFASPMTRRRDLSWTLNYINHEIYAHMGAALQATGRQILYNVSKGTSAQVANFENCGGNQTRYGVDIGPWWSGAGRGINDYFDIATYPQYAGHGHWMDPDQLMIGSGTAGDGYSGIPTDIENRTQFAVWCMWAAPLQIARSPAELTATQLTILKNTAMIAIDQDPMGVMAIRTTHDTTADEQYDVWVRPLGTASGTVSSWAICAVNRSATAKTVTVAWADIISAITTWQSTMATYPTFAAPSAVTLSDISGNSITITQDGATGFIAADIPSHGCAVIKVTP